jgi:hypothetical protein
MKVTPSYEACMKAYQYILPTMIEIAKKNSTEELRKMDEKSN